MGWQPRRAGIACIEVLRFGYLLGKPIDTRSVHKLSDYARKFMDELLAGCPTKPTFIKTRKMPFVFV